MPLIYVLVVNWNGLHHLKEGLPSLFATRFPNFKVILLDNGSTDNSQLWVKQHFPSLLLHELDRNRGFAAANNDGIELALARDADYVALLNNDTRVEPDWLAALVETAEADPTVAICQARQRTWDGTQELCFRFIPEWAEAKAIRRRVGPPDEATPTLFASGCAMLIRTSAIAEIGLFDERYFMYAEDVDLSLRAWIAGHRVMDVPAAVVYHRITGSGSNPSERMLWGYRNQLTTMMKVYEPETLNRFASAITRRYLGNRQAWRGMLGSLAMLPGTINRRRRIQRSRRRPDVDFLQLADR